MYNQNSDLMKQEKFMLPTMIESDFSAEELAEDADQHVSRVLEDFAEVVGRKREAHAEHHYAKQNRYPSAQRLAKIRERVSDNAEYEHPKRECFVDESAEFG